MDLSSPLFEYGLNGYGQIYNNCYLETIVPEFMGRAVVLYDAWQAARRAKHTAAP